MSGLDVSRLVRQHANEFSRRFRVHDHAGLDEDVLPFGDKGVHGGLVNEIEFYGGGIEPVGLRQGILVALEQAFGFGVPQQANLLRRSLIDLESECPKTAREK